MSKAADDFFENFKSGLFGSMHTCTLCRIVSFDPTTMKADVETLPDGDLITSIPVQAQQTNDFIIRVPYKPGNVGFVVFSQREIDGVLTGGSVDEESARQFAMDDAIFIGGINLFNDPMGAEHGDDLIISKKDYSSKIVLQPDGTVLVETGGDVTVKGATINLNP